MINRLVSGALSALVAGAVVLLPAAVLAADDPCGVNSNPVVCENSKEGTPLEDWYGDSSWGDIEGFTTKVSVQPGETLKMKVNSPTTFTVTFYRLGYYGGDGARKVPSSPTTTFPAKVQSACLHDTATGLVDCGNWTANVTWTVPSDAVSGVYLAVLDQGDGVGYMPYPFVVANDNSTSKILVQTSDETWQAYNSWGGQNLYEGGGPAPDGRAYKVSYNRPMRIAGDNAILASEYPMIQWLERNGYDVSYASNLDVSTKPALLPKHKVYLSSGHDEYWDQGIWDNVKAARAAGVNLAFFSGNEAFWRTRWESSIATDGGANRTLVSYKMTKMKQNPPNGIADPSGQWTGTWGDPAGAGTGGNKPQNEITSTLFSVNGYRNDAITVSSKFKNMRLWRDTTIRNLNDGEVATFPVGTLGYEWDSDVENAARPPGAIQFSSTTLQITDGTMLLDEGNNYGNGVATHNIMMYRDASSGALVFGSGTVQWSWGLSALHTGPATAEDKRMQQATANVLADMGAMPKTLQSNLVTPTLPTDTTGPTVNVTAPAAGTTVPKLSPITVTGTASDTGGQLGRVEVSTDGGTTWNATTGLANWTYTWTPVTEGAATIKVRGVDDSVNFGTTKTVNLTVGPQQCPCTTYKPTDAPANVDSFDGNPNELGAKFQVAVPATVTGVKFYKATANTGTHVGKLWTTSGRLLASGTFTGETASGWQTMTFSNPVAIAANTPYVVSYYTPTGHYSYSSGYFSTKGAGDGIVKQLQSGVAGANGVYKYGTGGGFPNLSWGDTNYWVDAVVETSSASTTPPTVTVKSPAAGDASVARNTKVSATFDHDLDPATVAFTLKAGSTNVAAKVAYDDTTRKATLTPDSALAANTEYTASVQASDLWGNAMTAPVTWQFTTGTGVSCPCTVFSSASTPDVESASEAAALELGMRFISAVDGYVTGVKFYKGDRNTGTHTGTLWSDTGQELATGTFTNETSSGWQTLLFATPVAITANTPYVVSYHTNEGFYSYSGAYFGSAHSSYPLTAVADSATGHNGLFTASASKAFPTSSWNASNYWVDAVFTTAL
ncbi:DUF4082 domain-containing protein [Actinoplanes regularis]|uniref:DUF4082 domain-containing protein n=1 Tax=Actinoplanes regularis TaxID=52697 RepID=UPI0025555770|nr:DUF4082 domain-containing protein [Actinoplanes regularis]